MTDYYTRLLLALTHRGEDVGQLLKAGLTYPQIADMLVRAQNAGLLIPQDGKLTLTEEGRKVIGGLLQDGATSAKTAWLTPEPRWRIPNVSPVEPYLPPEEDSHFDA